jgi:hypothetical protein
MTSLIPICDFTMYFYMVHGVYTSHLDSDFGFHTRLNNNNK